MPSGNHDRRTPTAITADRPPGGVGSAPPTGVGERIVRIALVAFQHCLPGQPADEQPYQGQTARQEQERITQGFQPGTVDRVQSISLNVNTAWC